MKKHNGLFRNLIPIICIFLISMGLFFHVYVKMMDVERNHCWDSLESATDDIADWIDTSVADNMNLLIRFADAAALQINSTDTSEMMAYISSIQSSTGTLFDRIDVIYPDGTQLMQNGQTVDFISNDSFEQIAERGAHISPRIIDNQTEKNVVYFGVPVIVSDKPAAILMGVVDCNKLEQTFESHLYNGKAHTLLIDRTDGNFIMDKWHSQHSDIYDIGIGKQLKGFEDVDFESSIFNGERFSIAFVSKNNGQDIYMHTVPLQNVNWSVSVMAEENVVFENAIHLRNMLLSVGVCISILLAGYIALNVFMAVRYTKSLAKAQQTEMEKAANDAKSAFLSSISHDIRTPLNGIVGMLDILETHKDEPGRLEDCLGKIRISTQFLLSLTNDVMEINEIESSTFHMVNEHVNLIKLVDELDTLVQSRAKKTGVKFHSDCGGIKNPDVMSSATFLNRILVNLITNGIKYNKEGGEVFLQAEEISNGMYRFTVSDTGIGVSEEFQDKIFEIFEQEVTDARTHYRGHGLGLAIVKRLVTKMGGSISLKSQKDVGSTFTVELPLQAISSAEIQSEQQKSTGISDLNGLKILLVEDNELNAEIAQVLLTDVGATVTIAENGRVGVDIFAASETGYFDIILMDIMMPEMNGHDATKTIRALPRPDSKQIPIIAMTASAFAEDVRLCMESGMNAHLAKPIDIATLITRINRLR